MKPLDCPPLPPPCRRGRRGTARSRRRCRRPGACRRPRSPTRATPGDRRRRPGGPWRGSARSSRPAPPQTVTSKKLGLSSQSPLAPLRRCCRRSRSLQTDCPLGRLRSSGSGEVAGEDDTVDVCRGHLRPPPSGTNESCGESRPGIGGHRRPRRSFRAFVTGSRATARGSRHGDRRRRAAALGDGVGGLRDGRGSLGCDRLADARGARLGAVRGGRRGARRELDDAEAHDAVGDLQRALQASRAPRACRGTAAGGTRRRSCGGSRTPSGARPSPALLTISPAALIVDSTRSAPSGAGPRAPRCRA